MIRYASDLFLCLICIFMSINENVKALWKNIKKHWAMHIVTQSMIQLTSPFATDVGGGGDS